jgi:hypothetical protein
MSYNSRIEAAIAVLDEHNSALGHTEAPTPPGRTAIIEDPAGELKPKKYAPGYVDPDAFIACIKASGGTSEDRLTQLSHEDILECLPGVPGPGGVLVKPRILAKAIAQVFRLSKLSAADPTETTDKKPVTAKKAERMTPRELVEAFDPEDFNSAVGVRLMAISKGEPFIVFSSGRAVDADTTLKLLQEVKQGYKGRDDVDVNHEVKKVYRIGELPENFADENPLYRNRPLRPDGTCDQTGRSWEGVAMNVRQLVRVAMDTDDLMVTHEQAHNILDMVMEADALKKLRLRYRQAAIKFDELSKTGALPTLKIQLGGGSEGGNPFPEGKQVVWAASPAVPNAYLNRQHRGGTYSSSIAPKK